MIHDEASAREWLATLPEYDLIAQARLAQLVECLEEENARQNLVAAASVSHIWQRHIADSAQLLMHVPRETGEWLDLGTGGGFPGLVIAILRPHTSIVMVESRLKRAAWLERVILMLGLKKARVIACRLEQMETESRSVISARAFAPLGRLLKLSARFSTEKTFWLLPKGQSAAHELRELNGWQHMFHVEPSLTDREAGIIIGRLLSEAGHGG